jgi:hypothetical protein
MTKRTRARLRSRMSAASAPFMRVLIGTSTAPAMCTPQAARIHSMHGLGPDRDAIARLDARGEQRTCRRLAARLGERGVAQREHRRRRWPHACGSAPRPGGSPAGSVCGVFCIQGSIVSIHRRRVACLTPRIARAPAGWSAPPGRPASSPWPGPSCPAPRWRAGAPCLPSPGSMHEAHMPAWQECGSSMPDTHRCLEDRLVAPAGDAVDLALVR